MLISSDQSWRFAVAPDRFWAAMEATHMYPSWWPWLRRFEADAVEAGAVWRCTVAPPLPYQLRFDLRMDTVDEPRLVVASVSGDISGSARLDVGPVDDGCSVRLRSDLAPARPFLRAVTLAAGPVARFGHDWVIDTGARQFRDRAM